MTWYREKKKTIVAVNFSGGFQYFYNGWILISFFLNRQISDGGTDRSKHTECFQIYCKSVLHLLKYTANFYLSWCVTELRWILGHSVGSYVSVFVWISKKGHKNIICNYLYCLGYADKPCSPENPTARNMYIIHICIYYRFNIYADLTQISGGWRLALFGWWCHAHET